MYYFRIYIIIFLALAVGGCARAPVVKEPSRVLPAAKKQGLYHTVKKGETLWGISRYYGVDIDKIVEANGLSDAARIETGQAVLIPYGRSPSSGKPSGPIPIYSKEDFIWPVKGKIITSFGANKGGTPNKGIDIQAKEGTTVVASRSGRVIFCEEKVKGFGKTVILDHGDGIQTVYSHNAEIAVSVGQDMRQGQPLAKVGASGRGASPYLHFEIRKRHRPQNPLYYLP